MDDLVSRYSDFFILLLVVFARTGSIVMLLPAFSDEAIPTRIRLFLALGIATGLSGLVAPYVNPALTGARALPGLIIAETMVGLSLGMLMRMMFQAIGATGSIISFQIGLSSAIVSDASMGGQATVVSRFLLLAATLTCLALNVHHLWFAAMLRSYENFPVGQLPPGRDLAELAVMTMAHAFTLSLSLAAPLIAFGVIFNVALGLVSRVTPALQLFMILAPLNLLLGVAFFAAIVGAILNTFAVSYGDWLNSGWAMPGG